MFQGKNIWVSEYKAQIEASTVKYILADRFDSVFINDLKNTFERCARTDSGNTLTAPWNFNNFRGIQLSDPVSDTDAANKHYVDKAIYRFESMQNQTGASGIVNLTNNVNMYSMNQAGAITFVLPTPTNTNVLNQKLVDIKTDAAGSAINVGTDVYFDRVAPAFAANSYYTIIWEYSNQLNKWVCGIIQKGTAI